MRCRTTAGTSSRLASGLPGYTLAHYLVNEGFGVVGIDGLKIEPLPVALVGTNESPPQPIYDWSEIYRQLDDRVLEGFGARLRQNSVQEKLSNLWLDHMLKDQTVAHV